jgi:alcohol dehydrogenase
MPFRCPTRVTIAPGCIASLPDAVRELGCERVLLATDPGVAATGHPERARADLERSGVRCELFTEIESNPRTTTALRVAAALRDGGCDGAVAIGGGSALDAAKGAAMLATNPGPPTTYVGRNRYRQRPLPLVAVPTTCGTGSEVTWVSVLTDPDTHTKISIKGDAMFPACALVDADLIAGLPPAIVASTALDALTHALEATTVRCSNPASDALAEKAIGLLLRWLPRAHAAIATDAQAREAVMRAATLAGLAFGSADVGAVHCLSETLGGLYDVPHGLANAMLLAPVLRAHGACITERLAELDSLTADHDPRAPAAHRAAHLLGAIEALVQRVGIPPLRTLGIPAGDHARIARTAVANGSNASNPRPMGEREYRAILAELA